MKTTIFILAILTGIIQACQKKTLPTITTRTTEPSKPVMVVDVKPDIAMGKNIFTTGCARCHDLPDPAKYTEQRWDGILKSMMPRARLNREQEIHLAAYVKANCAK